MKKKNPVIWVLAKLISSQVSHPGLFLLCAVALAGLSIFYTINNLGIQTSQKDLISSREHLIQLAERTYKFEQLDSFIVIVESPRVGRSLEFLRALVPLLEADKKKYDEIFYRVNPDAIKNWALLYLDTKDIRGLSESLQENRRFLEETAKSPTLVNFFSQINYEMSSKILGELFTGFLSETPGRKQPIDLEFLIRVLSEMKKFLGGHTYFVSPWDTLISGKAVWDITQEGYFWTKDKKYLLIFVTPVHTNEFTGTQQSLTALRQSIAQIRPNFPDINVGVTGPEALNADQMNTAIQDMGLATGISVIGLTILFIIFRRSIRRPVFEMITLLIALAWCFGLTTLLIGHLNILSVTFAPLILGLGIDNGAHWFARYQEEENSGRKGKSELLQATMGKIGPGILLAGANLAISFLPMTATGFKGLVELGVICFTGMIVTTAATLTILPCLLMLFDSPRFKRDRFAGDGRVKPFYRMTRKRVAVMMGVGAVGFGLSAWQAFGVRFDLNMLHLQSPKVESVVWEEKLLKGSELSSLYGEVLAPSMSAVMAKTKALEALPTVSRVESVSDLLPTDQEKKLQILSNLKPILAGIKFSRPSDHSVDIKALEEALGRISFKMLDTAEAGKKLRGQMDEVRGLIDQIRQEINSSDWKKTEAALSLFEKDLIKDLGDKLQTVRASVNARPMTYKDLPHDLLERFVTPDRNFLIRIYPNGDIWNPQFLGSFVRDLRSVDPDAVGDPVTLYVFTQEFRDSTIMAALLSMAAMFIFLLVVMRDFVSASLSIFPLLAGTVYTFGLMHPLGINLNLANSIFLPLIVGAGVEYGIIIVSRWKQEQQEKSDIVLPSSTAWGVVLAGLSTTVGFGSLMISSHRGIFSLGLLTTIGSLAVLAAAVLFLPAIIKLAVRRRR